MMQNMTLPDKMMKKGAKDLSTQAISEPNKNVLNVQLNVAMGNRNRIKDQQCIFKDIMNMRIMSHLNVICVQMVRLRSIKPNFAYICIQKHAMKKLNLFDANFV